MTVLFLLITLLLTGCVVNQYRGHNKIDETKIKKDMEVEELQKEFGKPLKLPYVNNVFFYFYSYSKLYFSGHQKSKEAKILRVEIENERVKKFDIINYTNYYADNLRTAEPDMNVNLLREISETLTSIQGCNIENLSNNEEKNNKIVKNATISPIKIKST